MPHAPTHRDARPLAAARWAMICCCMACCCIFLGAQALAAEPLPPRVDAIIESAAGAEPIAPPADDAEFLRRVYLDFTGSIPTVAEARAFLADKNEGKREKLIAALAADERFSRRLAELFHVILMERRGDNKDWQAYLYQSFKANKPWDQLAREVLHPDPRDEATRAAAFFYVKRLEKSGEQPTDYPGLTRDVGRLFLGRDLQCAQCHNHLTIDDYQQADFQGLFAYYQNIAIHGASFPAIAEKPLAKKIEFASVFNKKPKETGPRVPTLPPEAELDVPALEKGKEFAIPPDPKAKLPGVPAFSPLSELARQLPTAENEAFARNIVNRLWFVMMGRGLVHPLDLHHSKNPPSHPELLDLLAKEFVAHQYDVKWMLRELAMTKTYQRSSVLVSEGEPKADRFTVALERRLTAEQVLRSIVTATGAKESDANDDLRKRILAAFAAEPKEAEENVDPLLKAALFLRNDAMLLSLLKPAGGNLIERLMKENDPAKLADELYLAVLSRMPTKEDHAEVVAYLAKRGEQREKAIANLAWALLASAEFAVNH